ncbi:MAG: hypothetical protein SH847_13115 [Roseiflexaceae bacterium]|nr:hypothetical protein [Roseiflexaceae bacterium]
MAIGAALWLWWLRPHFFARSDGPSIRRGLIVLLNQVPAICGNAMACSKHGIFVKDNFRISQR